MIDMPMCMKCNREFTTPRGLDTHQKRSHPVSDSYVIDFLNLNTQAQEMVLALTGDQLSLHNVTDIVVGIARQEQGHLLRDAMSTYTGTEYRYVIREEP